MSHRPDQPRTPPRALLLFGLACLLGGVGLVLYDISNYISHTFGWPVPFGWVLASCGAAALVAYAVGEIALTETPDLDAEARPKRAAKRRGRKRRRKGDKHDRRAASTPTRRRRLVAAGIATAVAIQVAIPMSYYFDDDPFDERFAWRMFSAIRVYRCDVGATETVDGESVIVPLGSTIHVAWIGTLRRNRAAVVERFLEWRCEQGAERAQLTNRCVDAQRVRIPDIVTTIDCASGEIE